MVKFDVKTVNDLLGIDDAFKAPDRLMELLLKKEEREELFRNFLKIDTNLEYDWFHEYFETEQAERKSKKQDFTPDSVAKLANSIACEPRHTDYYEMAAGTGGMMIEDGYAYMDIVAATGLGITTVQVKVKKYGLREFYHKMHPEVRRLDVKVLCINHTTGEQREYETMASAERALGLYRCVLSQNTKNGKAFVHGDWEIRREIK